KPAARPSWTNPTPVPAGARDRRTLTHHYERRRQQGDDMAKGGITYPKSLFATRAISITRNSSPPVVLIGVGARRGDGCAGSPPRSTAEELRARIEAALERPDIRGERQPRVTFGAKGRPHDKRHPCFTESAHAEGRRIRNPLPAQHSPEVSRYVHERVERAAG